MGAWEFTRFRLGAVGPITWELLILAFK